jgi:diketogulonate reductase-like aldo/keto reductase
MKNSTYKTLSNGIVIPPIGMGTYPLRRGAMDIAIQSALSCGYRAFDTAYGYKNDDSLGNSLRKYLTGYGLKRSDVFITTKIGDELHNGRPLGKYFYKSDSCLRSDIENIILEQMDSGFKNLQTDYVDLLLMHYPYPDYFIEIWQYMEYIYNQGKARAIGVSNFRERHLKALINNCEIKPMVNQFECHPLNTEKDLIQFCKNNGILIEAYSPLSVMNKKITMNQILIRLSKKYGKTIPQIILRWNIQQGIIPIPKSGNPVRLKENISTFDFSLTDDEIMDIDFINENHKNIPESVYCPGY